MVTPNDTNAPNSDANNIHANRDAINDSANRDGSSSAVSCLTATNISACYEKATPILESINLTVEPGKVTVIGGPNGCGKSTLVKALARQLPLSQGTVTIDNSDIWTLTNREFAQKVAYVPQSIEMSSQLTVEELVALGRNPHQEWWQWSSSKEDLEAIEASLERTGMTPFKARYFANLSGGERQRALVATALAQKPKYILLDEPIAHLDFRYQLAVLSLIEELKKQDIGILVVLHDLNAMARLADDLVLLKREEGRGAGIAASGRGSAVLSPENIQRVFEVAVTIIPNNEDGTQFYQTKESQAN